MFVCDISISITGNVGSKSGDGLSAVGQVFISINFMNKVDVWEFNLKDNRNSNIETAVSKVFTLLNNINFRLELNKNVVQNSNTSLMLWKVDELISYISKYFTLKIGDIIFTGTPSGVGKVSVGDELVGYLEEKKLFNLKVK